VTQSGSQLSPRADFFSFCYHFFLLFLGLQCVDWLKTAIREIQLAAQLRWLKKTKKKLYPIPMRELYLEFHVVAGFTSNNVAVFALFPCSYKDTSRYCIEFIYLNNYGWKLPFFFGFYPIATHPLFLSLYSVSTPTIKPAPS
jgi:hypothetical protein